jgi:predicted CXXCH cytochrome family protein
MARPFAAPRNGNSKGFSPANPWVAFFFGAALSLLSAPAQAQGIDATVHDLTGGGVDEICVFCHTPHSGRPAAEIEVPLWNKPATNSVYQTYDSSTIDGDILALGSVSAACLTCHDGTQSTDVVINAPGSDGINPLGTEIRGGGRLLDDPSKGDFIGTDLTNDHPIGIQYGGFGTPPVDPDFVDAGNGLQVALINGLNRWWVDTEGVPNGTREKTDLILYTRTNTVGGGQPEPFVECGSCHDPHSDANEMFLRIENQNSAVCTACHTK